MTGQRRRKVLVAAALAAVAAVTAWHVEAERQQVAARQQTRAAEVQRARERMWPVVRAKHHLKARQVVGVDDVELCLVPMDARPALDCATALDQVVGATVLLPVYEGEPMVQARFSRATRPTALSMTLPKGKRALTVGLSTVDACAGFLRPGDRADVMAPYDVRMVKDGQTKRVTAYPVTDVAVLAIDKEHDEPARVGVKDGRRPYEARSSVRFVTLEVTPGEAERLVLYGSQARLALALRGAERLAGDGSRDTVVTLADLDPRPATVRKPSVTTVEQYRGLQRTELRLAEAEGTDVQVLHRGNRLWR